MRERILKIMEDNNLNQAAFADLIGVGRPSINHLINGRDKYSQVVASKTLLTFPDLNPLWLLKGEGNMYKNIEKSQKENIVENKLNDSEIDDNLLFPDMYEETDYQDEEPNPPIQRESVIHHIPEKDATIRSSDEVKKINHPSPNQPTSSPISSQAPISPTTEPQPPRKKIEKIVFFYIDQTFEEYYPKA